MSSGSRSPDPIAIRHHGGVDDYELIDAGGGARLERVGAYVVERPHASADGARRDLAAWSDADLVFEPRAGWRTRDGGTPEPWPISTDGLAFELRPTETAQLGFFPEHAASWPWLRSQVAVRRPLAGEAAPSVLNLFAYTGAATLVLAGAGASVGHVDSSRPAVAWGRRNAELSALADRPIRWLVDDAAAFVERELRRGRQYDGIVLDPPTYGHGGHGKGRAWRLESGLPTLLARCADLVEERAGFVLLTAHTPGFGPDELGAALADALGIGERVQSGRLRLTATSGATLDLGAFARWPGAR